MPHYAIGSSYLMDQRGGPSRLGGLRVRISRRADHDGSITIAMTDWRTGDAHPAPLQEMATTSAEAIKEFAVEYSIDLSSLEVVLDQFLFHDVDSDPRCYVQAARSAFRAALESLYSRDLPIQVDLEQL